MVVQEMTQIHVLQNWQLFSLICSYNFRTILKTLTLQYSLIGSFLRNATSRTWLLPKMILPVCYAAQKNMPAKYHHWGNYRRSSGYPNSEENIVISTEDVDILFWQGNWKGCRLPVRIMEVLVQHFWKLPFEASEGCFVGMAKYILNCKAGTDNDDDLVGKEILITSDFGSILY